MTDLEKAADYAEAASFQMLNAHMFGDAEDRRYSKADAIHQLNLAVGNLQEAAALLGFKLVPMTPVDPEFVGAPA